MRFDDVPTRVVYQSIASMILGVAKEGANERLVVGFLMVVFGNVNVRFTSESVDGRDVGFDAAPGLLGSLVMVEGSCRGDVVQVHRVLHGIKPEAVGEAGVEKEGARGLDERAAHALGGAVVLRGVRHRYFVLDATVS